MQQMVLAAAAQMMSGGFPSIGPPQPPSINITYSKCMGKLGALADKAENAHGGEPPLAAPRPIATPPPNTAPLAITAPPHTATPLALEDSALPLARGDDAASAANDKDATTGVRGVAARIIAARSAVKEQRAKATWGAISLEFSWPQQYTAPCGNNRNFLPTYNVYTHKLIA